MAAEIGRARRRPRAGRGRFNEAAANGRGNLEDGVARLRGDAQASMRPRRMAAEIARDWASGVVARSLQ